MNKAKKKASTEALRANHLRWHKNRGISKPEDCRWCAEAAILKPMHRGERLALIDKYVLATISKTETDEELKERISTEVADKAAAYVIEQQNKSEGLVTSGWAEPIDLTGCTITYDPKVAQAATEAFNKVTDWWKQEPSASPDPSADVNKTYEDYKDLVSAGVSEKIPVWTYVGVIAAAIVIILLSIVIYHVVYDRGVLSQQPAINAAERKTLSILNERDKLATDNALLQTEISAFEEWFKQMVARIQTDAAFIKRDAAWHAKDRAFWKHFKGRVAILDEADRPWFEMKEQGVPVPGGSVSRWDDMPLGGMSNPVKKEQ